MSVDIEATDLSLRYGKTTALDRLSFRLAGGRIYGLLGRNGSGKTSLLSVLAAFRPASSGTVRVAGEQPFENDHITRQICLIRESGDVFDTERVREVVRLAGVLRPYWDQAYAESLLELFRLPLRKRVHELSRGQRSALACVLGLASRAPLTIFDESYLGMDAPTRYAFYDALLADYAEHPRTVIISTHLIEEFGNLFEEVLIIHHGRLLHHAAVETLRQEGVAVTGPVNLVAEFVADTGLPALGDQQLGNTRQVALYGQLLDAQRDRAESAGLHLEPLPLQDLFVYLTRDSKESE